jgi:hypothetical protein
MPADTLSLEELAERFSQLAGAAGAAAEIGTTDPRAAMVLRLLEYGSVAGQRPWPGPGPRTTLAVDPESGRAVVISVQAPQGLFRIRAPQVLGRLRSELGRAASWLERDALGAELEAAARRAAEAALEDFRSDIAGVSGRLAESLAVLTEARGDPDR